MDALVLAIPSMHFVAKAVLLGWANGPGHPQLGGTCTAAPTPLGISQGHIVPVVNKGTKLQGEQSGKEQTQRLSRGFHCWLTPVMAPL